MACTATTLYHLTTPRGLAQIDFREACRMYGRARRASLEPWDPTDPYYSPDVIESVRAIDFAALRDTLAEHFTEGHTNETRQESYTYNLHRFEYIDEKVLLATGN